MNPQKIVEDPTVFTINGQKPGLTLAIMVGVHGNEKIGVLILDKLRNLPIVSGKVYVIVANPTAVEKSTRYINVNLNRRFGNDTDEYPEDRLARNIETYLDSSDALLDIHSYNESMDRPFAIGELDELEIMAKMPVSVISTGWDEFEQGASDYYMHKRGKIGVCLECGSSERPESYIDLALQCVNIFLAEHQLIRSINYAPIAQKHIKVVSAVHSSGSPVTFSAKYSTFDALESGTIFARMGERTFTANQGEHILFPRPHAKKGDEAFLIGKHIT